MIEGAGSPERALLAHARGSGMNTVIVPGSQCVYLVCTCTLFSDQSGFGASVCYAQHLYTYWPRVLVAFVLRQFVLIGSFCTANFTGHEWEVAGVPLHLSFVACD